MAAVHVMHVINQFSPWGGAEVSLREIIRGTSGDVRHTVVVLRPTDELDRADDLDAVVVSPSRPLRGIPSACRFVTDAVRDHRPDVVHTTLFDADVAGRVAALRTGTPVLTSLVNTQYDEQARAAEPAGAAKLAAVRTVDGLLARHATTAFHAISRATAEHAVRYLRVRPEAIRVVPRGRDASLLGVRAAERRRTVRAALGWADRPVVINVARQEPQKGHGTLVQAMRHVLHEDPDALLVLVGRPGRATSDLRAGIAAAGIGSSVVELGVRSDVADLMAAADVMAFPSRYEGLGGAVIEAAGLGLPVVCHDIPALREVLGDDHPWLVGLDDTDGFARAVSTALRGGPVVERVGANERSRFAEAYELSTCVAGMAELYEDVASSTMGRRRSLGRPTQVPVGVRSEARMGDT